MASIFSRFKRGGKGRRGGRGGRGSRSGRSERRDPVQETELIRTEPPPPAQQPAPPPAAPPRPAAPPPAYTPPPAPAAPPQRSTPPPPPGDDPGSTRLVAVGRPSTAGVVAVLIGVKGKLRDEVFKVFDGENTLGRQQTAEVYLGEADDSISRQHAQIIHREGNFGLKPLKENNPTFLNGERVEGGAPLSDGDEIGVGDSSLKFRVV